MNILEEYIKFEKSNIKKLAKSVLSDLYEEESFDKLLNAYIENRYYNFYNDKHDNLEDNIFEHLKDVLDKLFEGASEESKNKYSQMYVLFNYILCFDEVNIIKDKTLVRLLCDYRYELTNLKDEIFKSNISKLIATSKKKREEFFEYFHSDDFYLERNTTSRDNIVDIVLDYNINFSKLYSDYAIERVFNSDTINEEKLLVEYYLITEVIIKDIRECIFDKYYLLEFTSSLFENKELLTKLLNISSNDCFKSQAVLKVTYNDFTKYGNSIKDLIKAGYKLAIIVNDEEIIEDDFVLLSIFEYIIVKKDSKYCKNKDYSDKIVSINDSRW